MCRVKVVLLVGTRHDYQRLGNPGSQEFHDFVAATALKQEVKVIAEEMSLDALSLCGAMESVCKAVADSLGVRHCYCDPSREEQKRLGIAHPARVIKPPSPSFAILARSIQK